MFPAFMEDAAQAVAWTRAHAREWGGDPDNLFVVGHSAGAHIAVLLALDEHYLREAGGTTRWLRGVVGLSGPYDFLPFHEAYLNTLFGPPENFPRSQPINFVRAGAPPLLLMHGLQDTRVRVENTRSLAKAMQDVGGRVSTIYFEGANHTDLVAAFSSIKRHSLPVLQDIEAFVRETAQR
jgi:acetyl esterase/lipase